MASKFLNRVLDEFSLDNKTYKTYTITTISDLVKPLNYSEAMTPNLDHVSNGFYSYSDANFIGTPKSAENGNSTISDQPLTHYHSLVYSLLSWERPRATAASFASVVGFIIASRYLPLLSWALKLLYLVLGVTATAEITGRVLFSRGLASSSRPRKYYTIPKDTVESVLEDLEQLVDFFLIEFQRILFAENLAYTITAFVTSFVSYWLVKFLPLWGLAFLGACIAYLGPLIYISNKELIDEQVSQLREVVNAQAVQMKDMAGVQTAHATDIVKQYVGEYRSKANEYIGSTHAQTSPNPEITQETKTAAPVPELSVQHTDFPEAPKDDIISDLKVEEKSPELIPQS
ncbi:hypothetical protein FQN57_006339 [Myotisia sp. PD_48]|nr:hypothetical protein FQN57_006339 [Myotisia sp. PD_48]